MRVGVVDMGTNSTRLLVADVTDDGDLTSASAAPRSRASAIGSARPAC